MQNDMPNWYLSTRLQETSKSYSNARREQWNETKSKLSTTLSSDRGLCACSIEGTKVEKNITKEKKWERKRDVAVKFNSKKKFFFCDKMFPKLQPMQFTRTNWEQWKKMWPETFIFRFVSISRYFFFFWIWIRRYHCTVFALWIGLVLR